MKLLTSLIAIVCVIGSSFNAVARAPQPPDITLQGNRNELLNGAQLGITGDLKSGSTIVGVPFVATVTLTSAAAATPVVILPASAVPGSKKVYVTGFVAKVNGATSWTTTATVKIQDTNTSAVDFFTIAVAALTGNAELRPGTSNVTSNSAYFLGTGSTAAKGLQVVGNANAGAGDNLVVTVFGVIK